MDGRCEDQQHDSLGPHSHHSDEGKASKMSLRRKRPWAIKENKCISQQIAKRHKEPNSGKLGHSVKTARVLVVTKC